jgi:hypothetical protein
LEARIYAGGINLPYGGCGSDREQHNVLLLMMMTMMTIAGEEAQRLEEVSSEISGDVAC